jgi:cytochrome c biogenesis protein CcdA
MFNDSCLANYYLFLGMIIGLILIVIGALIMFFNVPKGKDSDVRFVMKKRVRLGMAILSLGVVIQVLIPLTKWLNKFLQ